MEQNTDVNLQSIEVFISQGEKYHDNKIFWSIMIVALFYALKRY